MNSHDSENTIDGSVVPGDFGADDLDDVTMAAGGDVVAQIRAHAAKVRSGELTEDNGLQIWTAEPEPNPGPGGELTAEAEPDLELTTDATVDPVAARELTTDATVDPVAASELAASELGTLLPHDQTVPIASTRAELADVIAQAKTGTIEEPVADLRKKAATGQATGGSLIDGHETPPASTSFWTTDQPFRASGIDAPTRLRAGRGIPLAAWIALVLVVIVVASVGIAVAFASMGSAT